MTGFGRSLLLAAVCIMAANAAQAQTIVVRGAPQGSTVELFLNDASVATAPARPGAETTLTLPPLQGGAKAQMDVRFWVDYCETVRRIFVIEVGLFPPAREMACDRKEAAGVYLAKSRTSFVIDLTGTSPSVWLRQGPVPATWLGAGPSLGPAGAGIEPRPGLLLGGMLGLSTLTELALVQCGNVTCNGNNAKFGWEGAATVWVFPFFGAEFSYSKPGITTLSASQTPLTFSTTFDSNLMKVVAKAGPSFGPVRAYLLAGDNYHRATITTTETLADQTLTDTNGNTVLVKGGTQVITMKTAGWGLVVGGGAEFWLSSRMAISVEITRSWLKGYTTDNSGIQMDDRKWSYMMGVRFRVGR